MIYTIFLITTCKPCKVSNHLTTGDIEQPIPICVEWKPFSLPCLTSFYLIHQQLHIHH